MREFDYGDMKAVLFSFAGCQQLPNGIRVLPTERAARQMGDTG
jgi:hypothetical protein